jgi:CRP-like cAMP-binding protein
MKRPAAERLIATTGWLSRQSEDFRGEVIRRSLYRKYEKSKVLFDIGDVPGGIYGVVEGLIELQLPNGHIGTIGTPGLWFGEGSAIRGDRRVMAAVAKSPICAFYLPLADLEQLIANAAYCRSIAMLTYEHLEEAMLVITSLMQNEGVVRVCSRLLSLAHTNERGDQKLEVTQSDLASMCGLSRQSVNKSLQRLADAGAIVTDYGKVDIVDFVKLREFLPHDPAALG